MSHEPEDLLLSELADLARQDGADKARLDERWDRLAAGTLTAEEEAQLRALAESSPQAREAWEAFRPLGPEFQARVVEKIAAELPKERRARLLPFRPAAKIGGWVTAAAAAAAMLVVLLRPSGPLPGYRITSVTGASEMRGEQPEVPLREFAPGDPIKVILHPEGESSGSLEGQLFLQRGDELRPLETRSESAEGTVKLKGSLDTDLQPGTWTLWAVVGRPGDLPEPAELRSLAARGEVRKRDWVALARNVRIQSRGP